MKREENSAEDAIQNRLERVFKKLAASEFRSNFKLNSKESLYLSRKGLPTILEHGRDFLEKRLAPPEPSNDGRQTPWGGHPVFRAQHATATCCRSCLLKWHGIPKKKRLGDRELDYMLRVIEKWLLNQSRL